MLQLQNQGESLNPFPDETILGNVNGIVSLFQGKAKPELSQTLDDLNAIKTRLGKIGQETKRLTGLNKQKKELKNDFFSISETSEELSDAPRSSNEMIGNGLKLPKPFCKKSKSNKSSCKALFENKNFSKTSLNKMMTVSPAPVSLKKVMSIIKPTINRPQRQDRAEKKIPPKSVESFFGYSSFSEEKQANKKPKIASTSSFSEEKQVSKKPKIVSTCFATCRIHSYTDNSNTFEIFRPTPFDHLGDSNNPSEIVFVVLASGQTAFYKTQGGKSLQKVSSN